MRNDKHSAIIIGENFSAFIDGIPDKCKHDDLGATVHVTASGKVITWKTFREWASYTSQMRDPLIIKHMDGIGDPVVECGVSCSKCGKPWSPDLFEIL